MTSTNTATTATTDARFSAQFTNIRTTLAGMPCLPNEFLAPTTLNDAYQQAAKWAASRFYGEVNVDYWTEVGQVPLWRRRGKTLTRVPNTSFPAGVGEVSDPCLCPEEEGTCLVVGSTTSAQDVGCGCYCHDVTAAGPATGPEDVTYPLAGSPAPGHHQAIGGAA